MTKNLVRLLSSLFGLFLGYALCTTLFNALENININVSALAPWAHLLAYSVTALIFGIIFYIITPMLIKKMKSFITNLETRLSKLSMSEISLGIFGLIIGLIISFLLTGLIDNIPSAMIRVVINVVIYVTCAILGINIAIKRKNEFNLQWLFKKDFMPKHTRSQNRPIILDTSIIIDGRIYDICKTGIIDTTIIIPDFVLTELRHIADSADDLKRSGGRRGLDILNMIQKDLDLPVKIESLDFEDTSEVDSKLLKLAKQLDGKVATNDYNLNKVASVQGVEVININELANAVKPIAIPGEKMKVTIIKQGKESTQGIAYLDDGTMIVVEDGHNKVDQELDVIVTSVLQTSAGRMIFARVIKS